MDNIITHSDYLGTETSEKKFNHTETTKQEKNTSYYSKNKYF